MDLLGREGVKFFRCWHPLVHSLNWSPNETLERSIKVRMPPHPYPPNHGQGILGLIEGGATSSIRGWPQCGASLMP